MNNVRAQIDLSHIPANKDAELKSVRTKYSECMKISNDNSTKTKLRFVLNWNARKVFPTQGYELVIR